MANLPHSEIVELEENLWSVEGSIPNHPLKRRMSIVRLSDGRLVFHSPMLLREASMTAIESLGSPAFIVIPNGYHRIDAANYAARYPSAQIIAPHASRKRVEKVVRVDGTYDALPSDPSLHVETLEGGKIGEGVFIVTSQRGASLVFNDTIFNVQEAPSGFGGFMLRLVGSVGGPKITPLGRLLLVKDKKALANHLSRLAALPDLCRLIPGHGSIVSEDVPSALETIAHSLS